MGINRFNNNFHSLKFPLKICGGWIFIFFLLFISCEKQTSYYLTQGEIFHTSYHIKYQYERELGKEIQSRLECFDLSLNPFNKNSIIYKVNHNEDVDVDDWFITVFNKASEVSEMTEGAYDITCAPLINLWGFGYEKMEEISPRLIDSLKQFTGYTKVRLEGRKVRKDDPRLQLNASSIAKGFACDVIARLFDSCRITNYLIEIGGEIHAQGHNPNHEAWQIEIARPVDDCSGQIAERQAIVRLKDLSLATSGNYRNFYIRDGKKRAHTINPITGYPAEENILSATVIYPDCMTADALATAFMVLGLEKAVALGDQIPGLDYLLVYADENGILQERKSRHFAKLDR
jgi:thiamine biosynthesis lipoprotein